MYFSFVAAAQGQGGVGYLFPGQGAQFVGMGQELYAESPSARAVFDEVDAALGRNLTELLFNGPDDELRQTENAQPAILAVSLACMKALEEVLLEDASLRPVLMAGHSLGEFTALAVAGVLDIGEVARLVQERGRLMQEACERLPGTMAAVLGLDQMIMEEISRETGTYVSNVNTDKQIVISGERIAVAQALDLASARGAKKTIPLRVGGAFHSALMEPAREGLVQAVDALTFRDPVVPIIANCTGAPLTKASDIKEEIIAQVCNCVQWRQTMDYMLGSGVSQFVEVGPGRILSSIIKRIDRSADVYNVGDMDSILRLLRN